MHPAFAADMTIRTAILEARFICGEKTCSRTSWPASTRKWWKAPAPNSSPPSCRARRTPPQGMGDTRYLVEPNVKEGKGGLARSQHAVLDRQIFLPYPSTPSELVGLGVLKRAERTSSSRPRTFLWAVRCHMHFLTGKGRGAAVLRCSARDRRAARLHPGHPGMKDVERFMKHYFLIAKDVGDLTRIFCAALEDEQVKTGAEAFNRHHAAALPAGRTRKIPGHAGFVIEDKAASTCGRGCVQDAIRSTSSGCFILPTSAS
jgi:[protein-PII] uridylyltransferase